jgi:carbonic anhydrase/acetyltransferase-like protein (isoleucine patch superfamily)
VRVFVSPGPAVISPLEAPARDAWVLDRTLGQTMAEDLAAAGLEVVPVDSLEDAEARARSEPEGAFAILDSVLCSPVVIRRFIRAARAKAGPAALVCALPRAIATDTLSHVEGLDAREVAGTGKVWTAPFYFLRGGGTIAGAEPALQEYRETPFSHPIPFGILGREGEVFTVAVGESYMCNVSHWVHVMRINSAAMGGWWVKRLRIGYVLGAVWLFWRFLLGFPWWGGRLYGAIRGVSWGARVHHTAVAELSVVKKGAIVSAGASLRNSFVDEGAIIGEGARVSGSVIGKGATVAPNSVVTLSVVYPGAMAGQLLMQASVLGKNSAAFTNSCFYDLNFVRNVRVSHRGRVVDSGSQMLGVCVGPEARVAAGIWVASGREVPAGSLLIKQPGEIATHMGEPARGEAHVVVDARVVPLGPAPGKGKT